MIAHEFGEGKKILLIPGNMMSWRQFVNVIPLLEKDHHVIAISTDGYDGTGKTTFTTAEASAETVEEYIAEVTGLRWKDIDLKRGTIDVNHTLVFYNKKHKQTYAINSTKTPCSNRVIPMLDSLMSADTMIDIESCEISVREYKSIIEALKEADISEELRVQLTEIAERGIEIGERDMTSFLEENHI